MRNEEQCVCSVCLFRCNIFIGFRIIKEMPGLEGSGTPYIIPNTAVRCLSVFKIGDEKLQVGRVLFQP